jgi:hypothetical protein
MLFFSAAAGKASISIFKNEIFGNSAANFSNIGATYE